MILETKGLEIGYFNKKKVLSIAKEINIEINKPKFISLIGKNGIGKSTLIRTLSNTQEIINGEIKIDGKTINSYTNKELSKKIAIVLTEKIPPNNLNVYNLIALGRQQYTNWIGKLTDEDKIEINNAIEACNIQNLVSHKINALSDGQYQKVMIARAIAQQTEMIFLDEPTAHLDLNNKIEIFKLLKDLVNKQKKLIIISSHEIQLVLKFSDDLWIMSENEFIADNVSNQIKNGKVNKLIDSEFVKFDKQKKQFSFTSD